MSLEWKPCTTRWDVDCPQGMVLETDPYEEGETPVERYRCQDCGHEEER